jgi:PAS domain S-box-containing protein
MRFLPWEGALSARRAFAPDSGARARSGFLLRVVLPAVLAVVLFVIVIFAVLIPSVEDQLLEGKQKTAQELTRAAVSILDEYYQEEASGRMTREQAQQEASARIENLRYGDAGEDYFWITDTHPTMIMHPYVPELNGQDLTDYEDENGKKLFVEFVNAVEDDGSGWVDYYWQWQDDPTQIVPKISYVQLFEPWQWVIGTGIYVEDVNAAVADVERSLIFISVAIVVVVALLLLYGIRQSSKIDRKRAAAEGALRESHEQYRALVEAATEGLLMTLEGRVAYANKPLLDLLGYTAEELAEVEAIKLLAGETPEDEVAVGLVEALARNEPAPPTFEARLRAKDGRALDVLVAATPISLAEKDGFILIVRSLSGQRAMEAALDDTRRQFRTMADSISLGIFRSSWGRKAGLIEVNPATRHMLGLAPSADLVGADWLERIIDPDERSELVARLNKDKIVENYLLGLRREDGSRVEVSLVAVLTGDSVEHTEYCDGILEDVTAQRRGEEERESLIAQLQTSLFYLQEPIGKTVLPAVTLDMNKSVSRAAQLMAKNQAGAIFVTGPEDEPMGIVTDHDFRERVVAPGLDPGSPVRSIMTAPVVTISADAVVYEALLRMEEKNIDHLAVNDGDGALVGTIRHRDLVRYHQSSTVISVESVNRAASIDEIVEAHSRLPGLVRAILDTEAGIRYVNRIVTNVSDAVVQRLLGMAMEQLGPAPTRFAFLTLGSEGREEQTLLTDQDNALLYEDPPVDQEKEVSEYFLALGTMVCDWLDQVGYAYCEGGVMAKNPRWNLPQSVWRQQFRHWIHNADPQELLELNMLFDFRCVNGEQQLAHDLRTWVFDEMETYPLFFLHFAQNALLYKPPLTLLGNLQTTSSEHRGKALSLKEALMPIVNYARLYALRHRIDSTNTLDRLSELRDRGVLSRESYEEVVPDYETLMRIRLRRQAVALEEDRRATNLISPDELSSAEEMRLKRLFTVVENLRKKIGYDFLGGIAHF